MDEPQLSVRGARDLAHRLARRENRSIVDIVEQALEAYSARETGREPSKSFYRRVSDNFSTELDLDAEIGVQRTPYTGPEL